MATDTLSNNNNNNNNDNNNNNNNNNDDDDDDDDNNNSNNNNNNNNNKLPERAHISPEEDWNFPSKNCWELRCFCITKIRLGEIFSRKKV